MSAAVLERDKPLRFYMEGFMRNDSPPSLSDEEVADNFEMEHMISKPKKTLKRIFEKLEDADLDRTTKKLALREVMMALISIIHGETK